MKNASSLLFENLMKYNDATQNKKTLKESVKPIKEEDETIINLQVELPQDLEDVKPEDVDVIVGVMPVETDENNDSVEDDIVDETSEEEEETTTEDSVDDEVIEDEDSVDDEVIEEDKTESLRRKRLEAFRKMKEAKANKTLIETNDVETAKKNILARAEKVEDVEPDEVTNVKDCTGKDDCQYEACKAKVVDTKAEGKKESLARLDTTSLNRLITAFVKDNYKNIDKITITKAMLENKQLTLKGTITNTEGKTESIALVNKGFDVKKLEGKKFVMDFTDGKNTFGIVTESIKKPFVFIATLKEGVLKFESLKYNFKTKVTEGKIAKVFGKCTLKEAVEPKTEDANQVKRFQEIVDKIKECKNANDLIAVQDEMKTSGIGETLMQAAQMVWDDVCNELRLKLK